MSQFRRMLLMMMHKVQEIWRDVVLTGTGLVVANDTTAGQPVKIFPQGWTEQAQYEGNQLFDASVFDGKERSGVRVSVDNGVITASGMSESAIWIQSATFTEEDFEKFKSGNIYVKNYKSSECNYEFGIYINNTTVKEGNSPHPIPDGYLETKPNNVCFFIDIRAGIELKGSCKPIVYQDGDGTWEPYTGEQPSPSPEYPQEIKNAGKYDEASRKYEYEVKLTGANLFNPAKLTGGEIVEYNGVQCYKYTDNSTNFTYVDDFAENTQYCFSVMVLSSEGNEEKDTNISIVYTDGTRSAIYLSYNQLMNVVSSANKTVAMITGDDSWSVARYIDLTMTTLGIGTEPVPYQPYKNQTVTLTSDRPLTKWDRLVYMDGQWQWEYSSGKVEVDGSSDEDLFLNNTNAYGISNFGLRKYFVFEDGSIMFCNGLTQQTEMGGVVNYEGFLPGGANVLFLRFYTSRCSTVEELRSFLAENPLTFEYETNIPTYTPLPESEQKALNALRTYYPTTVFSNDQNGFMQIEYRTKYGGDA